MQELIATINFALIGFGGLFVYESFKKVRRLQQQKQKIQKLQQSYPLTAHDNATIDHLKYESPKMIYLQTSSSQIKPKQNNLANRIRTFHTVSHFFSTPKYLIGQYGGSFKYNLNGNKIKVDIKECNIHRSALKSQVQQIVINNQVIQPFDISFFLKFINFSMLGIIKYNIQQKQLVFQPSFLASLTKQADFMKSIQQFYQNKIFDQKIKQAILIAVATIVCTFSFLIFKQDIMRLLKFNNKRNEIKHVEARSLKCACGSAANIIGQCHHLSLCQKCFQQDNQCRICNRAILNPRRIYT